MNFNASATKEIVQFARQFSPYYRSLYQHLPESTPDIEQLPITDIDKYWSCAQEDPQNVLTGTFVDGVPLRSGGSTNEPKTTYMTRQELRTTARILGNSWVHSAHLLPGDRVANLMTFGGMYGGYWNAIATLEETPIPIVHLPITGAQPLEVMVAEIQRFQATVLLGPLFTLTRLADYLAGKGLVLGNVRQLVFTGETLFEDIRARWKVAYPNAYACAPSYASVDAGQLGVLICSPSTEEDAIRPVYKVGYPAVILEILADDGTAIKEAGVRGNVVVTQLIRRLQPIIRYPVGDVAEWVDYSAQTLKYCGRASIAVKIATTFLDLPLMKTAVARAINESVTGRFQCIVRREHSQYVLVFRLAIPKPANANQLRDKIDKALGEASPKWKRDREGGAIAPLALEWVNIDELIYHEKSGKLKEIIEARY
ncbi:putative NRPS-like protein biosynthetic cluster [Microsporum audouinii]